MDRAAVLFRAAGGAGFPGCWWAAGGLLFRFSVFAVPVYGLVYAVFRAYNGAKIVFMGFIVYLYFRKVNRAKIV